MSTKVLPGREVGAEKPASADRPKKKFGLVLNPPGEYGDSMLIETMLPH